MVSRKRKPGSSRAALIRAACDVIDWHHTWGREWVHPSQVSSRLGEPESQLRRNSRVWHDARIMARHGVAPERRRASPLLDDTPRGTLLRLPPGALEWADAIIAALPESDDEHGEAA